MVIATLYIVVKVETICTFFFSVMDKETMIWSQNKMVYNICRIRCTYNCKDKMENIIECKSKLQNELNSMKTFI